MSEGKYLYEKRDGLIDEFWDAVRDAEGDERTYDREKVERVWRMFDQALMVNKIEKLEILREIGIRANEWHEQHQKTLDRIVYLLEHGPAPQVKIAFTDEPQTEAARQAQAEDRAQDD